LPKTHRYTLGKKFDESIISVLEAIATAAFLDPQEKIPYIKFAIKKNDLLKIFLMLLWETKSLDNNKYIALSEKTSELGKMLGGWLGKIAPKQNSSAN
jgi:23S rRNA-intervening sequence protein